MVWKEVKGNNDYWNPETEDEVVEGVIINVEDSEYGHQYTLETEPNRFVLMPNHKLLQGLLTKCAVGQRVKVTYKGAKNTGKINPLRFYKVEVWSDEDVCEETIQTTN